MKSVKERLCIICLNVAPSKNNFGFNDKQFLCSGKCRAQFRYMRLERMKMTRPCCNCGKLISRTMSGLYANMCCGRECSSAFKSSNMKGINAELNPERMENFETRVKIRNSHLILDKGEGKAYKKIHGRHAHRVVAEEKIGRPLEKGEVVHHKDENKLNNDPDNLEVLESQSEHAKLHMVSRWKEVKNDI